MASRVSRAPTSMEITITEEGESSRANYPEPIREFTEEERKIIKEQLTMYAGEAKKFEEEAHRESSRCIHRVLPRLKESNGDSLYEPNTVSIGPYYYNLRNKKFKMAEDYKKKCFGSLVVRNRDQDMYMSCLQRISKLEEKIRKCYSEEFEVADIEFFQMMVVDACFIIKIFEIFELFRTKKKEEENVVSGLEALAVMVPYFCRDFLLLENQIPFFVLEEIFALTNGISVEESRYRLQCAALSFFRTGMKRYGYFVERRIREMDGVHFSHLLDLVRWSLIPSNIERGRGNFDESPFIHCISKLQLAGIKVRPVMADSFLEVKFKKGVIEMPNIAIDDLTRCLLLNCVAFEQCHQTSRRYFPVYATFLDCLVNTEEDVEYLRECNVIDNYLPDDSELAGFINGAGKGLVFGYYDGMYWGELFEDVEKHYNNRWKWKYASFERDYEKVLSLSAAMLVVSTSVQAVMAFLTYKYKNC